ncbi:MAG: hypothetical protein ACXAB4_08255, partial [Candidatus Hodarchaeales archaeon]
MSFIAPQGKKAGILAIAVGICAFALALGLLVLVTDSIGFSIGSNDNNESHIQTSNRRNLAIEKDCNVSNYEINTTDSEKLTAAPILNLIGGYEPQDAAKTLPVWQKSASMGMIYFGWEGSSLRSWSKPNNCSKYWERRFFGTDSNDSNQNSTGRGLPEKSGSNGIELISEYGSVAKHTVPGTLSVTTNICDIDELPLYLDEAWLDSNWWITVDSVGGYEPAYFDGALHQIEVWQGYDSIKEAYRGTIGIDWTSEYQGDCCNHYMYYADFVLDEAICLDSNQWPEFHSSSVLFDYSTAPLEGYIPDKEVTLFGTSTWSGCTEEEQSFELTGSVEKNTEKGTITVSDNICDIPDVPLCIDEAWLDANWDIRVVSVGGYHPCELGMQYIDVYQGYGTNKQVHRGTIYIDWDEYYLGRCTSYEY